MPRHLLLVNPSANRVFAGQAAALAAAELELCVPGVSDVEPTTLAGVDYVAYTADDAHAADVARLSSTLALFAAEGELLRPVEAPRDDVLDDDLVSIPKYQGKTNEQFTRLLLGVTLAQVRKPRPRRVVLDPLCGRGTTLSLAWTLGCDAGGVEGDEKAVEAYAAYLKTYLRRKRLKHTAELRPVRREGQALGQRFEATLTDPSRTSTGLSMTVFTGDTRTSAELFGKKKFDAVVADAPYGVVHGSHSDVRGTFGRRDRSAAGLLRESVPVWAEQLTKGGAMGLSWNTLGMPREDLAQVMTDAGLTVMSDGPWLRLGHRVDSSIHRDVIVGVREIASPRGGDVAGSA